MHRKHCSSLQNRDITIWWPGHIHKLGGQLAHKVGHLVLGMGKSNNYASDKKDEVEEEEEVKKKKEEEDEEEEEEEEEEEK